MKYEKLLRQATWQLTHTTTEKNNRPENPIGMVFMLSHLERECKIVGSGSWTSASKFFWRLVQVSEPGDASQRAPLRLDTNRHSRAENLTRSPNKGCFPTAGADYLFFGSFKEPRMRLLETTSTHGWHHYS
jgi:hypothetical protein